MKNFKRLAAAALAAAMALALSVSAFAAEAEVQNAVKATYTNGKAAYTETITADDGTQMTVAIFKEDVQNDTISASNLEYINQDAEGVLNLSAMGTKNDLLSVDEEGAITYAGNYVIRVGYYTDGEWTVDEGTFTIQTKQTATGTDYTVGDVDGNGSITIGDVTTLIDKVLDKITYFTNSDDKVLPYLVGDTDNNTSITIGDVTTAIDKVLDKIAAFEKPVYTLSANTTAESTYPTN